MPHVHASCCVQKPKADSLSGLVKQRARARKEQVDGNGMNAFKGRVIDRARWAWYNQG